MSYYERLLKAVGSLSKLFSEAPEPYLAYRATENLFCKAFEAENLSRSDASADASKNRVGFGLKTFLEGNGRTMQKVAEFNGDHALFKELAPEEKIRKIAELRNERLETTKRIFGLDEIIYHCITRQVGRITVYETPAPLIDITGIKNIKVAGNTIQFADLSAEYSFSLSKSTLYKRFYTENVLLNVPVRVLDDPFTEIEKLISEAGLIFAPIKVHPHVFLPLYSTRGGEKHVPEKSGLNQWNAGGRARDPNEIYIPIPAWVHQKFPTFFPKRDEAFELTLPDRTNMSAKVCQDNSKALMSNPNSALGKWLLRDILNLPERELLTYKKLEEIGLDTVVIYKIDNEHFDIDFTRIGSYEKFLFENGERAYAEGAEGEDEE
ncbi:MAG: NgoFVII family restriction endonuclease [bacterium]|nr:NgoFVII family restriction endonuclease [bacterium]